MGLNLFAIYFAVSAGAIAVWVDARFPRLAPPDFRNALIRLAGSFVIVQLTLPATSYAFGGYSPLTEALAVAAVGYVVLTFAMLTAYWIVRIAQQMLSGSMR